MSEFLADRAVPFAIYGGGNLADHISTERALGAGARETNPHGQSFQGRLSLRTMSLVVLGGTDLVLQRAERRRVVVLGRSGPERRRPFAAKLATGVKWVVRVGAAAHFARVAWGNRRTELEQKGLR